MLSALSIAANIWIDETIIKNETHNIHATHRPCHSGNGQTGQMHRTKTGRQRTPAGNQGPAT